jgi:3-hydroxymyristoyl/3-hydroxydecanoyl-(acyl carrier protein) dehydratase
MAASSDNAVHVAMLRIAHDHACLAGHFPGRPVVPGVLLLARILDAAEKWLGFAVTVRSLPQVKFIAPLLPEEDPQVELQRLPKVSGEELRFIVRRNDAIIAQGVFGL